MEGLEVALSRMVVSAYREWGVLGAIGVILAGIALIVVFRALSDVWNHSREVGEWIGSKYRSLKRIDHEAKIEATLSGVCAVVLIAAAISRWPYFMYTLLRLCICTSSTYLASRMYSRHRVSLAWLSGAIAVLFNPILPVKMTRSDWETTNLVIAVVFLAVSIYLVGQSLLRARASQ